MSKPARNEELSLILNQQDNAFPLAIRMAVFERVDHHIEDLVRHNAHYCERKVASMPF